jgi:hypothetical protein
MVHNLFSRSFFVILLQGSTAALPLKTSIGSSLQRGKEDVSGRHRRTRMK